MAECELSRALRSSSGALPWLINREQIQGDGFLRFQLLFELVHVADFLSEVDQVLQVVVVHFMESSAKNTPDLSELPVLPLMLELLLIRFRCHSDEGPPLVFGFRQAGCRRFAVFGQIPIILQDLLLAHFISFHFKFTDFDVFFPLLGQLFLA